MAKVIQVTTIPMALKYLLLDQMKALRREGYIVLGASAPSPDSYSVEAAGFDHIEIPALSRRVSLAGDIRAMWQLHRLFRKEQPEIVHSHTPKATVLSTVAARLARVPIVVSTIHGFYSNELMKRRRRVFFSFLEWLGLLLSHYVLFRNNDDLLRSRSWPLIPGTKLGLQTGGIDLDRFNPNRINSNASILLRNEMGLGDDDKVVGFVGRLVQEKGVLDLLRAAPDLCEEVSNIHFIFVGPTETDEYNLKEISESLGVAQVCHFVGQRDDVENWYALMDVFVLPSYREGFPKTAMEASAMGVPIVSTDVRGCRDAVVHEVNGLIVPPGNVQELGQALSLILLNADVARQLGTMGRQLALERFDQGREFEILKSLYHQLITRSHSLARQQSAR